MRLGNRGLPSRDVNAHATMNNPVACHDYPTSARVAENNPFFTLIHRLIILHHVEFSISKFYIYIYILSIDLFRRHVSTNEFF